MPFEIDRLGNLMLRDCASEDGPGDSLIPKILSEGNAIKEKCLIGLDPLIKSGMFGLIKDGRNQSSCLLMRW